MLRATATGLFCSVALAGAAEAQIMTAASTYESAPGKLTATEVQALFAGKHEENGVDTHGNYWTIRVASDGTASFATSTYSDTGKLAVRASTVCVSWEKAWKGEEQCFRYAHHGPELASYGPDGKLNSTLTVSR